VQLAHTQITAATAAATTTTVAVAAAITPCHSSALIYKQSSSMG